MKCEVCGEIEDCGDGVSLRVGTGYEWRYVELCRRHALTFALRGIVEIRCTPESMVNSILAEELRGIEQQEAGWQEGGGRGAHNTPGDTGE